MNKVPSRLLQALPLMFACTTGVRPTSDSLDRALMIDLGRHAVATIASEPLLPGLIRPECATRVESYMMWIADCGKAFRVASQLRGPCRFGVPGPDAGNVLLFDGGRSVYCVSPDGGVWKDAQRKCGCEQVRRGQFIFGDQLRF